MIMFKWKEIQENPDILTNFKSSYMINIECSQCGGTVSQMVKYVKKHLKDGYKNKFCSNKCKANHSKTRKGNCLNCNKELVKGQFKFCSSSCSAKVNNHKREKKSKLCNGCGKTYHSNHASQFCSQQCNADTKYRSRVENWINGNDVGYTGKTLELKQFIRRYLFETRGTSCSSCGFDAKHPKDGKPIVEIDHIDGDVSNNRPDNLRILCPNCHALTPTFRARNKLSSRIR